MNHDQPLRIDELLENLTRAPDGYERQYLMPYPLPDDRQVCIDALALDISGRCNLACRYCAEASTQPTQRSGMSSELLTAILSFLKMQQQEVCSLRFGSGEPMLNRNFLLDLQLRLDEMFPKGSQGRPGVFITTNGTLIEESDVEWLASTGWHIKVSFDGPEAVHDRWRVLPGGEGTHARVAATVREFARLIPELFSVTAVLTAGNDPFEVFGAIEKLGVRRIELVPAVHNNPDIHPGPEDIQRFRTFVEHHVHRLIAGEAGVPTLVRFANCVSRAMGYNNSFIQCGAGRNFFGVDHSGTLFPCFRFIGIDSYRMGTLTEGIDRIAARTFRNVTGCSWEKRNACRNCWAAPLCGGPCFAVSDLFGAGDGEPLRLHCAYTLIESHGAWRMVDTLRQSDPMSLLEYLPQSFRHYAEKSRPGQAT